MRSRSSRALRTCAPALLAALAACTSALAPVDAGPLCTSDGDCDPGDDCVNGSCQGSSAGGDAGSDAGARDAGPVDAGSGAGSDAGSDAGARDAGPIDAGADGGDAGSGSVGLDGGAVDLLDFSFTGDTRSPDCDDASGGPGLYPQATFESALQQMASLSPQLAFDLGDHMYVCSGSLSSAQADMKRYTDALAAAWPSRLPFFMTMGNHECSKSDCSGSNKNDPNFVAYSAALQAVSQQAKPYYAVQVATRLGRATFLFVSDNYDSGPMQSWLSAALADADANSAYTFIIKHYPVTGSRQGPSDIESQLQAHHFSLLMTAHEHDYAHDTTSAPWSGRSVICGLGGANASAGNQGFCRVQQQPDGTLRFTQYDLTGNPGDSWSVGARQ